MKKQLILMGLTLISTFGFTQENISLNLKEAQQKALSNNITIKNAQLAVQAAQHNIKASVAQGLPQAEGTIDYSYYFDYEIDFSFSSSSESTPNIDYTALDAGDMEIMKLLEDMGGSSEPIIMEGSASGGIQVSQLLFSGQYWVGIQTAKLAKLLSEKQLEQKRIEIIESVTNVYYGILILEESIDVLESSIDNLHKTQRKTAAMVRAGLAEETDTLQIQLSLNALSNNISELHRSLDFNYTMLKFLLGISYDTDVKLTDKIDSFINEQEILNAIEKNFSVSNNIDYQLIETQVALSEKMVSLEKMSYAPTLAGFYTYNYKFQTTGIDMTPNHIVGLSLQVPLFSSGQRYHSVQKAKIEAAQTRNAQQLMNDNLVMQMQQAQYNLKNAYENYLLQKENIELAETIYIKTQRKYEYGVVSSFELTQANNSYLEAQSNYLQAYIKLCQEKNALDKLTNSL
ncbi:MAG: TolC family protein [Bacteroidales bacterium]|jgi:outer membrane protein|nr:TolC family protein [Bacteroidales bacterium]